MDAVASPSFIECDRPRREPSSGLAPAYRQPLDLCSLPNGHGVVPTFFWGGSAAKVDAKASATA